MTHPASRQLLVDALPAAHQALPQAGASAPGGEVLLGELVQVQGVARAVGGGEQRRGGQLVGGGTPATPDIEVSHC